MNKEKLIIVGDSAFAEIAYEYFTYDSDYEVVAFSVEKAYLKRNRLFGLPAVPFEDLETMTSFSSSGSGRTFESPKSTTPVDPSSRRTGVSRSTSNATFCTCLRSTLVRDSSLLTR